MHICKLVLLSFGGMVAPLLAVTLMIQTREQLAFLVGLPAAASGAKSPGAPRPGGDMGGTPGGDMGGTPGVEALGKGWA